MMTTPNSQLLELGSFFRAVAEGISETDRGGRMPPKPEANVLDTSALLDSMRAIVAEELRGSVNGRPMLESSPEALLAAQADAAASARRIEELSIEHRRSELELRQQLHERYETQLQAERNRHATIEDRVLGLQDKLDQNEGIRQAQEFELRERAELLAVLRGELHHAHEQAQELERSNSQLIGEIEQRSDLGQRLQAVVEACQFERDEALRVSAYLETRIEALTADLELARAAQRSQEGIVAGLRMEFDQKFEERESEALHMLLAAEQRAREDRQEYAERLHALSDALGTEQALSAQLQEDVQQLTTRLAASADAQSVAAEFGAREEQQRLELSELRGSLGVEQARTALLEVELSQLRDELSQSQAIALAETERLAAELLLREDQLRNEHLELAQALAAEQERTLQLQSELSEVRTAAIAQAAGAAEEQRIYDELHQDELSRLSSALHAEQALAAQLQADLDEARAAAAAKVELHAAAAASEQSLRLELEQVADRLTDLQKALDAEQASSALLKADFQQLEALLAAATQASALALAAAQEQNAAKLADLDRALSSEQALSAQLLADLQNLEARSTAAMQAQESALAQAQSASDSHAQQLLEAQTTVGAQAQALSEARTTIEAQAQALTEAQAQVAQLQTQIEAQEQAAVAKKRAPAEFLSALPSAPPVAPTATAPIEAPAPVEIAVAEPAQPPMTAAELSREAQRLAVLSLGTDVAPAKQYFQLLPWQGLKATRISIAANERGSGSGTLAGFAVAAATQQAIDSSRSSLSSNSAKASP